MNTNSVPTAPVPWSLMLSYLVRGKTSPLMQTFLDMHITSLGKVTTSHTNVMIK